MGKTEREEDYLETEDEYLFAFAADVLIKCLFVLVFFVLLVLIGILL